MDNYESLQEKVMSMIQPGDWETVYTLLQDGDAKGDSDCTSILGDMYLHGIGVMPDAEHTISQYEMF